MENIRALTEDCLSEFAVWFASHYRDRLALDTETNGLWPWLSEDIKHPDIDRVDQPAFRCTHLAIAAADGSAWVVDGRDRDLARRTLQTLDDSYRAVRIWAHNADFDTNVLRFAFGVDLPLSDSITLVKALQPGLKSYSLKSLRPKTEEAKDRLHTHFRELHPVDLTTPDALKRIETLLDETVRPKWEAQGAEWVTTYVTTLLAGAKKPEWICERAEKLVTSPDKAVRRRAFKAFVTAMSVDKRIAEAAEAAGGEDALRAEMEDEDWLSQAFEVLPFDDPYGLEYVATDAIETAKMVADSAKRPPSSVAKTYSDPAERKKAKRRALECALVEVDVQRVYDQATSRGYRIDAEMLEEAETKLADEKAASIAKWGIDLTSSSNATREWLAERDIVIKDREGKDTLSAKCYSKAKVPEKYKADWEEFRHLRDPDAGGIAAHTNFLTGMRKNLTVDADGIARIHGKLTALGTDTGRTASTSPNVQNVSPDMRAMFMADPGHILVGADFDQVEPRALAATCQDPAMIEAVKSGDPYSSLAVTVWGEQARKPTGPEHETCGPCEDCTSWAGFRKKAKVALLALQYGQGVPSMAANLGISEPEASRVKREFAAGFPILVQWSRDMISETEKGHYFFTSYGRPLPQPLELGVGVYTRAVNWRIQSVASDIFKRSVLTATRLLGREAMWLPIHDELIVQVPDTTESRIKALDALREAMNFDFHGVPIQAEPELIGPRWEKLGAQPSEYRFWKPPAEEESTGDDDDVF